MNHPYFPANARTRRPLRRRSQLLPLEQRFMFDGAVADAAHAAQAHDSATAAVPPAVTVRAAEPAKDQGKKEVVLVDTSLANYKSLEAGIRDGVGIVEFDGSGDGLAQIAQWAATQQGLDAIHILSHGAEGVLDLGVTNVTSTTLSSASVQAELAQLGQALSSDGDLLLYGCSIGADNGALLSGLAQATGADVAASTDLTGAERLGGNWTLEAHSGEIDVRALALLQYDGVLDVVHIGEADLPGHGYYNTTVTRTINGQTVSFTGPNLLYTIDDALNPADASLSGGTDLTISVANGATFSLASLKIDNYDVTTFSLTYGDGSTASFSVLGNASMSTMNSFAKPMSNLTRIVLTSDSYVGVQDFNISVTVADTTPPTTTFGSYSFSNDSYLPGDLITNVSSQTIGATLSATLDSGDVVWGSTDDGGHWTNITSKVSGTTLSWTGATLSTTNSVLKFKVTDQAGNDSAFSTKAYTLDQTPPTTTISTYQFSSDTNIAGDFKTSTATQTISGTLSAPLESGETVFVSLNNGTVWSAAATTVGQNTFTLNNQTLSASNTLKIKVSDLAGNNGTITAQAYTYDNTPPSTTVTSWALSDDKGESSTDFKTNIAAQTVTVTLSGALDAEDTLYGSTNGGTTWSDITSKVSGSTLSWDNVTLAGSSSLQLKVMDIAGNTGSTQTKAYVYDNGSPAASAKPVSASGDITNDNTPTITGTGENGATVSIYDGATKLGTAIASGGVWSFTAGVLSEGVHNISAIVTDVAGNLSPVSQTLALTVDTSAPTVASVDLPANGTYYAGDTLEFSVHYGENVTVDTTGGTPRIQLTLSSGPVYADYVSGSGSAALTFRYVVGNGASDADGISIAALGLNSGSIKDAAGNNSNNSLSGVGSTAGILVDGTQATITNVSTTASYPDGAYSAGSSISITVSFSSAVTVSGGVPTLALNSGGGGSYSGGSGTNTLTFTYTVGAGQNSSDLDVASTSALALNGASIIETGGAQHAASITLFTPGSAGSLGANRDIVIDTQAPANVSDTVSFSDDTGTYADDLVTNKASQTIRGDVSVALAADEHVLVSLDNGATWTQAVASAGSTSWQLSGQTLTGSGTMQVRVSDDAGNNGSATSYVYQLDQAAPGISFTGIALLTDSGTPGDLITNTGAQTVSATLSAALSAGDIVEGSLDGGNTWTPITSKVSGTTLTWDNVTLIGNNTLQFRVTDLAGNVGTASSQAYQIDTTPPGIDIATIEFSNDSGASGTDFITNTAAQTVRGTLTGNIGADETVYVSLDNGASWQAASAAVGTSYWELTGQTLTASNTLQVKVTDSAGNDGTIISQAYVYDTSASVPSVDALTTMSLTPVLGGSATLAAGETMTVSVGGATYDVVPVAGSWSLDLATAVPVSGALTLVLNTQYSVTATVTDLAGNTANDSTSGELIVGTLAVPATPPTTTISGTALSSDSGASNSDFITNVAQQTISGNLSAALRAGESVEVSLDGGATWSNAAASGSSWSYSATLSGSGTLVVRVSGDGGSGPRYSHSYTLDTVAPATPSAEAQTSTSLTPVLSGAATLADGEQLSVSVGGADYAVSVTGGRWSLDLASATPSSGSLALVAGGSYSVVASVTDLAGNRSSASSTLSIGSAPAVTSLALSADSGANANDFITNVATQTVSGTLSAPLTAGQTVQVSVDGGTTWQNASASGSSWSASVTLSGSNTLAARVSSADGGAGTPFTRAYVLDTSAPGAVVATSTVAAGGNVSGTLSAAPGAGETVMASLDGGATWSAISSSGVNWSFNSNGASSVQVLVRDLAGNNGAVTVISTSGSAEPLPPVRPEPVPPPAIQTILPVLPVGLIDVPTNEQPGAPLASQPALPLVLPQAGISGDLAINWPGQTLPTVVDTLPSFVGLQPMPDFGNTYQIITLPTLPGGDALVAYMPIADVSASSGRLLSVQLGSDAFAHSSDNASVTLSAQLANGAPLPGWLKFDGKTARFEGTPPLGFEGTLSFRVVARDSQGRLATQVFKIVVSKDGKGEKTTQWHSEPAAPVGRASLGEQLRDARSAAAARLAALSA
jgi:hypothetical protein